MISYRRADTRDAAGRLCDALQLVTSDAEVFFDTRDLEPGPFDVQLFETIEHCRVVFVVLGPLGPSDWVLREVMHAKAAGKLIIPILTNEIPPLRDAPESSEGLRFLASLQAYRLRADDFDADFAKLVNLLRHARIKISADKIGPGPRQNLIWWIRIVALQLLLSVILIVVLLAAINPSSVLARGGIIIVSVLAVLIGLWLWPKLSR